MGHLLPQLAYRKAMLFEIDRLARPMPTAAAVLWTMSLDRDPNILTSFRIKEANLFEQAWKHFDTLPRHMRISVSHNQGHAHLHLFKDGSAILSRENEAGVHDVLPLPLRLNRDPSVTATALGNPWHCPTIKIWANGANATIIGLHDRPDDRKDDAREFLDFGHGEDTQTNDPKFQPVVDVLIEDIRRAADIAAAITDPFLGNCTPGATLPDGTTNRWSPAVPYMDLSEEEIAEYQRRAYLAGVLLYEQFNGDEIHAYSTKTLSPIHRANNVVQIDGCSLTYMLGRIGVTEEDFLGYGRKRLGGFRLTKKRRRNVDYLPQNPETEFELDIKFTISAPPSAHELIEAQLALVEAKHRKAARRAGETLLA